MNEQRRAGCAHERDGTPNEALATANPDEKTPLRVLVRLEQIHKRYRIGGHEVRALAGVDLEIRAGELTFVIGPSGSGKSTLLHLIGALDRPCSGRVWAHGRDLATLDDRARARYRRDRVGFIFQAFHLLDSLDAIGNVVLGRIPVGVRRQDRERAQALLRRVGLGDRLHHRPTELSGGEQQRVAVARALLADPPLVLADEPTGELDSSTGREIMALLRESVGPESAVVVVTHDTRHIAAGDRVIELADGRVIAERRA